MRKVFKLPVPDILADNHDVWTAEYKDDKNNKTKKYRYRHESIKAVLKNETASKCVYCESKIGHNTPGDVEHKIPSSKNPDLHFAWENLTIACTECNRRKNNYYVEGEEFLDPYVDEVEALLKHHGPVVFWKTGEVRSEITIRILELNSHKRSELVVRKIEKLEELHNILERYEKEVNPFLQAILNKQIIEMSNVENEFSGMIASVLKAVGV